MQIKKTIKLNFFQLSLLAIFLSANISSQDANFDAAFLDSLPDEVKEDVLQEVKSKNESESTQKYQRTPSSKLLKSNVVKKWNQFLEDQATELDDERFGMSFFRSLQTSFMPINEPNFDPNYLVDYGDILEIQLLGPDSKIEEIDIKRDGSINIKDIGKIFVGGMPLYKAEALISQKVADILIGTKALVSLTSMRDIQILVTGYSFSPGVYTLNGGSNILHALNVSGGIKENGSLRNIQVNRNGVLIHTVDLYDYFINGNLSNTIKLRSGDSISIQPAGLMVYAEGGLKRPYLYEMKSGETLSDLLNFAQGFNEFANLQEISYQYFKNGKLISEIINHKNFDNHLIEQKSGLYVSEYDLHQVKVSGAVEREGTYIISENETLSSVIKRAGGYKSSAYIFGGILLNDKAKKLEIENQDKIYSDLIKFIATSLGSTSAFSQNTTGPNSLGLILDELKNYEPVGRIQAEFDLNKIDQNYLLDTTLSHMDEIHIPKITQQVYVLGEVGSQGAIRYIPNSKVSDYIKNAGGYTSYTDDTKIYIVSPSGKAQLYKSRMFGSDDYLIYPGSVIYVPRQVAAVKGVALAGVVAPIFSSLALSLASLNAINK